MHPTLHALDFSLVQKMKGGISKIPSLLDNDSDDVSADDLCRKTRQHVFHSASTRPISCTSSATSSCSSSSHLSTEDAFKIATLFPQQRPQNGSYNQHRSRRRRRCSNGVFRGDRHALGRVESIYSNQTDASDYKRREQEGISGSFNIAKETYSDKSVEGSAPLDSKLNANESVSTKSAINTKSTNLGFKNARSKTETVAKFIRRKSRGTIGQKCNNTSSGNSGSSRAPLMKISQNTSREMSENESQKLRSRQKELVSCPQTNDSSEENQKRCSANASKDEIITNNQTKSIKRRLDTSNDSGDIFDGCSSSSDDDTGEEKPDKRNDAQFFGVNMKPFKLTTKLENQIFQGKDDCVAKRRKRRCLHHAGHQNNRAACNCQPTNTKRTDTRDELRMTHSLLDDSIEWNSENEGDCGGGDDVRNKSSMIVTTECLSNLGGNVDKFGSRIGNSTNRDCPSSISVTASRRHSVENIFRKTLQKSHDREQLIGEGQNDKLFDSIKRYMTFPRKSAVASSFEPHTADKEVEKTTLNRSVRGNARSFPSSRNASKNFTEKNDHELNEERKADSRTRSFASSAFRASADGFSSRPADNFRDDGGESGVMQTIEAAHTAIPERNINRDAHCNKDEEPFTSSYPTNVELTHEVRAKKLLEELIASKKEIALLQEQCASLRATERIRSSQIKTLESQLATAKSEACEVIPLWKMVDRLRSENRSLRAEILRDFSDRSLLDK